jgi:F420-0:gamma-glutamyl ligase
MKVTAIKTRAFLPPKDDLFTLIKEGFSGLEIQEESIIVVTSKIVSIWQGRCVKISKKVDKDELIKKEADYFIDRASVPRELVILTLKNNLIIPSSGIDASNANGYYVLWPDKPFLAARHIHQFMQKEYGLKKFGVIISDSRSGMLRLGVTGIGLAYWGFLPLKDYRGKKDIFGRELKLSQTNVVDSLACAAVFEMGEGNEQTPIAVIDGAKGIVFTDNDVSDDPLSIDRSEDIYAPLLNSPHWQKGGKSDTNLQITP